MPFKKRRFFSRRKFRRYTRKIFKSPRVNYKDISTVTSLQFLRVVPTGGVGSAQKYAISASLIGKNIVKGSMNWAVFAGMYAFIRPLSISVQVQLGTCSSNTNYVNQGIVYYDKKARTVTEFTQVNTELDAETNYQALLKNFGVRLIGSSNVARPVNFFKFRIPFIDKKPIPEAVDSEQWDNQFGALFIMLEGLFAPPPSPPVPPVEIPFGTVRIIVRSRFYQRSS